MSTQIRARVVVDRRVDYRHAHGQSDGILMDLSLQGCQINVVTLFVWDAAAAAVQASRAGAARGS
jgi:hypothetical protein